MTTGDAVPETEMMAKTGVPGLDDVLGGGLAPGHVFLIEGTPGTGKTTIALRFLMAGAEIGETGLYVTLSETEAELRQGAASHGWQLDDRISVFELAPPESLLDADQQQSLLYSSDLELGETTKMIFEVFERTRPKRVVLDSLSEIRLLAQSSLRYRRQLLALKHYFARHDATVLLLDDMTAEIVDKTVHSVVHGVINLQELAPDYGAERRRMRVVKYRGKAFRGGYHDMSITTGGLQVFPRLVSAEHRTKFFRGQMTSDVPQLDALLGGGIEQGSSTLLIGPAGTGKSLFVFQFIQAAIRRGEKAALFAFDEELGLLFDRTRAMGFEFEKLRDEGRLLIEQVDAAELSPGEFAHRVRKRVDEAQANDGRDRQSERIPGGHARGKRADRAHPRTAAISQPPGRHHIPDRRSAWLGRRHEEPGRCDVPCRYRGVAPLFRSIRKNPARSLGRQEANGISRGYDTRVPDRQNRTYDWRTADPIPGRA